MDNTNYTPKRLQSNKYSNNIRSNNTQIINEDFNINDQQNFPDLIINTIIKNTDSIPVVNWNNISRTLTDEPIKELEKIKNKKEIQQDSNISESIIKNKEIPVKIKSTYIDESGWTHVIKSNKPIYKEKKKKTNTEDIDKLIETTYTK